MCARRGLHARLGWVANLEVEKYLVDDGRYRCAALTCVHVLTVELGPGRAAK